MKHSRLATAFLLCGAAFTCWGQVGADVKPDNTKTNKRDRNPHQATADDQKMNASDTELTRKIRQSIMADKTLSTYAHNVKIISQDGMVTMKGPVKSEAEKKNVIAKAVAIAAKAENVINQISVAK